jgi:hypothetical protein
MENALLPITAHTDGAGRSSGPGSTCVGSERACGSTRSKGKTRHCSAPVTGAARRPFESCTCVQMPTPMRVHQSLSSGTKPRVASRQRCTGRPVWRRHVVRCYIHPRCRIVPGKKEVVARPCIGSKVTTIENPKHKPEHHCRLVAEPSRLTGQETEHTSAGDMLVIGGGCVCHH